LQSFLVTANVRYSLSQGRQSWGIEGVATPSPILGWGVRGGSQVGSWWVVDGSWNIIISYQVQEVCSKVVTF